MDVGCFSNIWQQKLQFFLKYFCLHLLIILVDSSLAQELTAEAGSKHGPPNEQITVYLTEVVMISAAVQAFLHW